MAKYDWSKVTRENVINAIARFNREKPDYPEPKSYYLIYEDERFPAKYIRGMAYKEAFGEELTSDQYPGGNSAKEFLENLGFTVEVNDKNENKPEEVKSWKKISDSKCVKTCDPSFFDSKITVIPGGFAREFFGVDNLKLGDKHEITLIYNDQSFKAEISVTREKSPVTRLTWRKNLGDLFRSYKPSNNQNFPKVEFEKVDKNTYNVTLISFSETIDVSVVDAVWIAAATISYEKYKNDNCRYISDFYLSQTDIVERARLYTSKEVNSARVSQWCCGDSKGHSYSYLKEVKSGENKRNRRLSFPGEFSDKPTEPSGLNMELSINTSFGKVSLKQIYDFVHEEYAKLRETSREIQEDKQMEEIEKLGLNTILYGPPGTGKTYNTVRYAVSICEPELNVSRMEYDDVLKKYNKLKEEGRIEFITFHQSYSYEEFIEGIKPLLVSESDDNSSKDVKYDVIPGIFKKFCSNTKRTIAREGVEVIEQDTRPYVFIIDEINRGNISKIFGELITLIEETKRDGAKEKMEIKLPYSGNLFSVPNNVYILGTMNTADRSIAIMDTALRRRFDFIEKMPDTSVIKGITVSDAGETLDVAQMLDVINQRIEYLFDREHTIGHAFFTKLREDNSLSCLAEIFKNNVIPLLQEYFYEDYEKIQLVLGDNDKSNSIYKFVLDEKNNESTIFKGTPDLDIKEKKFTIQKDAFNIIQSYIEITEKR